MRIASYDLQRRVARFREQRWLLDAVIKLIGPEFDQSRLHYLSAPLSPDYQGAVMELQALVKRWDDIAPEFAAVARYFELQAHSASAKGHEITASDDFFAASVMYGGAQWPIFANTDLNKTYEGKLLAGYFHLLQNYTGDRLPCLVMIEGMDAFKELAICGAGDRFLRRGFACLVIDGPGQGTSLFREIWYDPDTYGKVGTAAVDWLLLRHGGRG